MKLLVLVQTSMAPAAPRERTMRAMKALGRTMYILIPMKSFRRLQGQKPTCKPINRCCDVCSALGSRMAVGTVPLKKPGTLLFETLGSGQLLVRSVKHSSALTCSCPWVTAHQSHWQVPQFNFQSKSSHQSPNRTQLFWSPGLDFSIRHSIYYTEGWYLELCYGVYSVHSLCFCKMVGRDFIPWLCSSLFILFFFPTWSYINSFSYFPNERFLLKLHIKEIPWRIVAVLAASLHQKWLIFTDQRKNFVIWILEKYLWSCFWISHVNIHEEPTPKNAPDENTEHGFSSCKYHRSRCGIMRYTRFFGGN